MSDGDLLEGLGQLLRVRRREFEYVLNLDKGVRIESTGLLSVRRLSTLGRYADCRVDGKYRSERADCCRSMAHRRSR
jgi:hypothetical protein